MFAENIVPRVVTLKTGEIAADIDAATTRARQPRTPRSAARRPPTTPRCNASPHNATIYEVRKEGKLGQIILPVEGKGLWSTLYGYLALKDDLNTINGLTFYQHAETPGLGGEVDNPRWKALWPGRKAFGDDGKPAVEVVKGQAGTPEEAPYAVDGLSGATITSRGVTYLIQFWLGDQGFGPYLNRLGTKGA